MRILIELSGEHPTLPRAEALAALESERVEVRAASWTSKVLRLDAAGPVERAARRLGLAHVVLEELASGTLDEIRDFARGLDLRGQTFRVRSRGLGVRLGAHEIEGALGADLGRTGKVDLTAPTLDLRLLVGQECVLGRVLHLVERSGFESRKVARRSFSLPISLHPKLARALVNLSRVPTGGTVLDPFCGTGGILLEAHRIGLRGIGADAEQRMVRGARTSLHALHATADLVVADAGRGPWSPGTLDGIATDPPYGRAASTRGEPIDALYDRAFASFADVLARGRHLAAVLPNENTVHLGEKYLELVEAHALRVHRSLTRTFCAFRRR